MADEINYEPKKILMTGRINATDYQIVSTTNPNSLTGVRHEPTPILIALEDRDGNFVALGVNDSGEVQP